MGLERCEWSFSPHPVTIIHARSGGSVADPGPNDKTVRFWSDTSAYRCQPYCLFAFRLVNDLDPPFPYIRNHL